MKISKSASPCRRANSRSSSRAERGERLRLIARLFDLEVYGDKLNAVVRRRQDEAKSALDRKEGELSGYAAYTAEELTEMREERAGLSERLQKAEEEYLRSRAAFEKLKGDYTKGKKLAEHRAVQRALERRADEMTIKRADLALLPAAEKIAGLLSERQAAEKELRQCTQRKEKLQEMKSRAAAALSAAEERLRGSDLDGALLGLRARRESLKVLRADIDELGALAKTRSRARRRLQAGAGRKSLTPNGRSHPCKAALHLLRSGSEALPPAQIFPPFCGRI